MACFRGDAFDISLGSRADPIASRRHMNDGQLLLIYRPVAKSCFEGDSNGDSRQKRLARF
jgi:hypothetical protein